MGSKAKAKARAERDTWIALGLVAASGVCLGFWIGQAAAGEYRWSSIPVLAILTGYLVYRFGQRLSRRR